jgi:hypothetical protein|tara:strand:+ start:889 stop:1122 length:234 start_codon:yes stop_codon:yes gene_type:complete
MRKYTIITQSELVNMNFSLLLTTSEDTARPNLDKSEFVVSFEGDTPSFLEGKTIYTNSELFEILENINNNWITKEEL